MRDYDNYGLSAWAGGLGPALGPVPTCGLSYMLPSEQVQGDLEYSRLTLGAVALSQDGVLYIPVTIVYLDLNLDSSQRLERGRNGT